MTNHIQQMRRRKLLTLLVAGLVVATMLILVVFNIDPPADQNPQPQRDSIEVDGPAQLTAEEIAQGESVNSVRPQVIGAQRAWVQFMGPDGRLEKQYRCQSLDPLPDGWSRMTKPEFEALVSDDRMITMTSDSAMIHMPSRQPESGTLSGDVIIRNYEIQPGEPFDAAKTPILEIRTDEAIFDNTRGEIRCDGKLLIQTSSAQVDGRGLRLLFNEIAHRAEWMKLEHGTVRISSLASANQTTQPQDATTRSQPTQTARAKKPPAAEGATSATQPQPLFYRLTFNEQVRIQQVNSGWEASGDELAVIFSLEGGSLSNALSFQVETQPGLAAGINSPHAILAALAVAAAPPGPQALFIERDDDVVITCKGGIAMSPLVNSAERPESIDDARFEMAGRPLRIRNPGEQLDIECRTLVYQMLRQRAVLNGDVEHPLIIDSPQMRVSSDRLWINRMDSQGGFEGKGWMTLHDEQVAPQQREADPNAVRLTWADRVDLRFQRPGESHSGNEPSDLKLEAATFRQTVRVLNPDLEMNSDTLEASFASADPNQPDSARAIRSVLASGNVRAKSLADDGTLACESLNVDFAPIHGRTIPLAMLAKGKVHASDPDRQTIWADRLEASFFTDDANASAGTDGRARVRTLSAHDGVQVLLADGARAFADQLEADTAAETVILTGNDLLVVSENSIVHGGSRLDISTSSNSATWPGAGEFVHYSHPIIAADAQPIAKPSVSSIDAAKNPVQLRARWSESMVYDGSFNDGAGAITLTGSVHADSMRNVLEHSTADGNSLTLQFAKSAAATSAPAGGPSKQLQTFIAQGDERNPAKLESRSWLNVDHSDKPRVFYIAGPHITYDDMEFEAQVQGAGELLIRDERIEATPSPSNAAPPTGSPMSAQGTTSFRWKEGLDMTRAANDLFDITMRGRVEVIHRALDEAITLVNSETLRATVQRTSAAATQTSDNAFDLGGAMELRRLDGSGGVHIEAPSRKIDCEQFEYDYQSSLATLNAAEGGTVAVFTTGEAIPLRARQIRWNMKEDTLTVSEPVGGAHR